jgi:hypothetical protein
MRWAICKKLYPSQGAPARAFAARINAAGSAHLAQDAAAEQPPSLAGPAASVPLVPQPPDAISHIKRLGKLRDQGLIMPEEFGAKKTELLGRLERAPSAQAAACRSGGRRRPH